MGVSRVWVRELRRALTWQQLPAAMSHPLLSVARLSHFQKWAQLPPLLQEAKLRPPLPGPWGCVQLPPLRLHPSLSLGASGPWGGSSGPPSRVTVPGSRTHPALSVAVQPPAPPSLPSPPSFRSPGPALPCPAPTAARKDAARVPCQRCECAAPPSRARNAAGPRGRPQTQGSGQAQHGAQAGRWPWLARTRIASRRKASCLPLNLLPSLH